MGKSPDCKHPLLPVQGLGGIPAHLEHRDPGDPVIRKLQLPPVGGQKISQLPMLPGRIKAYLCLRADAGNGSEKIPPAFQLYQSRKGLYDLVAQGSCQIIAAAVGACGRSRLGACRQDQEISPESTAEVRTQKPVPSLSTVSGLHSVTIRISRLSAFSLKASSTVWAWPEAG